MGDRRGGEMQCPRHVLSLAWAVPGKQHQNLIARGVGKGLQLRQNPGLPPLRRTHGAEEQHPVVGRSFVVEQPHIRKRHQQRRENEKRLVGAAMVEGLAHQLLRKGKRLHPAQPITGLFSQGFDLFGVGLQRGAESRGIHLLCQRKKIAQVALILPHEGGEGQKVGAHGLHPLIDLGQHPIVCQRGLQLVGGNAEILPPALTPQALHRGPGQDAALEVLRRQLGGKRVEQKADIFRCVACG